VLKLWIGRDRPPLVEPDPEPLVLLPVTGSFPSGHATVAFACATVLSVATPRLALPLYSLAALIAFSRVYVGVHYPLDTLAGAALGAAIGLAVVHGGRALRIDAMRRPPRAPRRPRAAPRRSRRTPPAG
jgi:undecaprenyl-diphosphatase